MLLQTCHLCHIAINFNVCVDQLFDVELNAHTNILIYVIHNIALLMPTGKINYELILFFTFLDLFIDPPVLSFVQFRMHHLFLVSWKSPIPNRFLNHYNITIVPAQVNAINNIVTSDASAILKLNNQTLYNITVGATICSDLVVHRMFTAGRSPILLQ